MAAFAAMNWSRAMALRKPSAIWPRVASPVERKRTFDFFSVVMTSSRTGVQSHGSARADLWPSGQCLSTARGVRGDIFTADGIAHSGSRIRLQLHRDTLAR